MLNLKTKPMSYREVTDEIIGISRDPDKSFDDLYRVVEPFDNELRYLSRKWWQLFYLLANGFNQANALELKKESEIAIQSLIHVQSLLYLYALMVRIAHFDSALIIREQAKRFILEQDVDSLLKDQHDFAYHIAALHEEQRYDDAGALIEYSAKRGFMSDKYYRKEREVRFLFTRSAPACLGPSQAFAEYIQGKNVAIVSPSLACGNDGSLIDSFDLVVKCNHRSNLTNENIAKKGQRCDISYYSTAIASHMFANHVNFPGETKWFVFKQDALLKSAPPELVAKECARSTNYYDYIMFNGALNAIPNMILDLLLHGAGSVNVFHADLMTSVNRINGYDPVKGSSGDLKKKNAIRDFSHHDPMTQFSLMKRLYACGTLLPDCTLKTILDSNEHNYADLLNRVYR